MRWTGEELSAPTVRYREWFDDNLPRLRIMRTLRPGERFCRTCPQLDGSSEPSLMIRLAMSRVLEVYKPRILESLLAETILC